MLFVQKQQKHFHLTENVETTNSYSILEISVQLVGHGIRRTFG